MKNTTTTVRSYLGVLNCCKAKYGAAMQVLRILSNFKGVTIDWDNLEKLLTEVRLFSKYGTEADYICEILSTVILDDSEEILFISPEVLNIPPVVLEPYCEHFINDRELNFFNHMYQTLIRKCILCCKNGYKNFVIDFKYNYKIIKWLYTDKRRMNEKIEYFLESMYEFIQYNGFFNVNMYEEKFLFGKYKLQVVFEVNLN